MTAVPDAVAERIRDVVGEVRSAKPVGGGCIAHATQIETERGRWFLKWGEGDVARSFRAEAAGLQVLRAAPSRLLVPDVVASDVLEEGLGFLLQEWIEPGAAHSAYWNRFGTELAKLHGTTSANGQYGFEAANFIGRTPQHNAWTESWPAFFRSQRLVPQIGWAREAGYWSASWDPLAAKLIDRLGNLLPEAPPASLVHGDLWSGNVLQAADGRAALIDPAVYYGHRETDLALAQLFGGFDARFFAAYREAWPLESGYAERREVYNLYHLINHLNLFGRGYASRVERILRRFG